MSNGLVLAAAVLLLIFAGLALRMGRVIGEAEKRHREPLRPEDYDRIVRQMLETIKREGRWGDLEQIRLEVRRTLAELDRLRHDTGNAELRASKAARSAK